MPNKTKRGLTLFLALVVLAFAGTILGAAAVMLVATRGFVDGELAALRARAALISAEAVRREGRIELEEARADVVLETAATGEKRLHITAVGLGQGDVTRTLEAELKLPERR